MNAPQTVEEWIALAIAQGVVEKRESLPFTGSRGEVIEGRPLVEWIRNRVAFPYDCGLDHGALQWPISDEQRNDAEFMRGYAAGLDELKQNQQVDKGVAAAWERLNLSGLLASAAPSQHSGSQWPLHGSQTINWKSAAQSCLQSAGLFSLAILCIRFLANLGATEDD